MNPSTAETRRVPSAVGADRGDPAPIAAAVSTDGGGVAKRVLVRNLGGAGESIFLSTEIADLQPEITSETFELPGGASDVFVLAPGQFLYARTETVAGRASVMVSDAFPVSAR